jgi:hypothetical protein
MRVRFSFSSSAKPAARKRAQSAIASGWSYPDSFANTINVNMTTSEYRFPRRCRPSCKRLKWAHKLLISNTNASSLKAIARVCVLSSSCISVGVLVVFITQA